MRLSIQKFQELYAISKLDIDQDEKAIKLIQSITGLSEDGVNSLPIGEFNKLCRQTSDIFSLHEGRPARYIRVGTRLYKVHHDITKQNAGRYVEAVTYGSEEKLIPNLHRVMATIVQPVTWYGRLKRYDPKKHEQYANDMLKVDFSTAYHSAVFFYALFTNLIRNSKDYLIQQAMAKGAMKQQAEETLTGLLNTMDGFIQPKWLRNLSVSV